MHPQWGASPHQLAPFHASSGLLPAQGFADKRSSPVRDVNENGNVALSVPHIVGADFALDRDKSHCAVCLMVAVAGESGVLAVAFLRELLNFIDLASQQPFKLLHSDFPFRPVGLSVSFTVITLYTCLYNKAIDTLYKFLYCFLCALTEI